MPTVEDEIVALREMVNRAELLIEQSRAMIRQVTLRLDLLSCKKKFIPKYGGLKLTPFFDE